MIAGCLGLLFGLLVLPTELQNHWLAYMLPVACACTGLAFMMGTATSYALEPFEKEAGTASALVGFIQMAVGAALSLLAISSPLPANWALAMLMLVGGVIALVARNTSLKLTR